MIPVSVNTPREKETKRKMGSRGTRAGAGEQFLLKDCRTEAHPKGVFYSQTPVVMMIVIMMLVTI